MLSYSMIIAMQSQPVKSSFLSTNTVASYHIIKLSQYVVFVAQQLLKKLPQ